MIPLLMLRLSRLIYHPNRWSLATNFQRAHHRFLEELGAFYFLKHVLEYPVTN